jgi:SAM-dependent methyltransferase
MVISTVQRLASAELIDAVDFGCADGFMLTALRERLPNFRSGLGLDVFRAGMPTREKGMSFEPIDLFKELDRVQAGCANVAIVSSFIKHHPDPIRFLQAVRRALKQGGIAIVLDPRPFVVHAGALIGRFNKGYIPSLWSKGTLLGWLESEQLAGKFELESFDFYWRSPVQSLEWMERSLPPVCSLHQCAVLRAFGCDAGDVTHA